MNELILRKENLTLTESQIKMIKSGWGEEEIESTTVEKITYLSDGLKVKAYLAYPNDRSQKYPCVIWCRGGIGQKGVIDQFNAQGMFAQLASWGFVVFAPQYRGNDGGEGTDEFGGRDLLDILNLIPLAEEVPQADTSKWGIEGWSRGGMMTYLILTKTNLFKAAIVTGGIANLRCNAEESTFMKILYESTMGNKDSEEFNEKCHSRSVVNFAEKISKETPLLIIHGADDDRVLPHDSLDLSYKLLDNKNPFRLVMLEGGDHFLKNHRIEVDRLRKNWLNKYLY